MLIAPANTHLDAVGQRLLDQGYRLLAALPLLALALLVIALAWWLGGWVTRRHLFTAHAYANPFLRELVRTTVRWSVLLAGVLIALEIMNATALVGAVLGTAGVLGVVLGFAFKEILENYLAGILLSLRQPFAPNDHIDIAGHEGVVVSLNARSTVLMTLDGNHVRLPNALVFASVILNYTRNPRRRFEIQVGVGVNEDLIEAQRIGAAEMRAMAGVLDEPPPRASILSLGDSNVVVAFHGWVDQAAHDFLQVRSEAIRRVKAALDAAGMDMPEPIYRVQLHEARATAKPSVPPALRRDEALDTRATRDISRQIAADQVNQRDNLLDPDAPRE
ncbi:mechanosensitive ion channel family protein [Dyella sp.]|jgi:small-conductance mechanosensitive channel|uniref:mechanosensitive ion channel family protein n=1 Tax=Dyella sp. TaxID=1869338 RepID=UPI002D769EE7|nr:mechanosensitive ion channel family protein [Dyella sp.]HET6432690.1 mechanosensitive ion channel family protein [Dyella sp.]